MELEKITLSEATKTQKDKHESGNSSVTHSFSDREMDGGMDTNVQSRQRPEQKLFGEDVIRGILEWMKELIDVKYNSVNLKTTLKRKIGDEELAGECEVLLQEPDGDSASKETVSSAKSQVSTFNCKHPESLLKTQEQPVTLGRRGPKSNQSPSEEEDPGAAYHLRRKRTQEQSVILGGRGPRNS
ncbi:hypothetical protein STEG23_018813 [Scotinomys teguina]